LTLSAPLARVGFPIESTIENFYFGITVCAASRCCGCRIRIFQSSAFRSLRCSTAFWIATVPPTVKLATAAFGKERGAMIFGWIFAAHQIGSAVAAYGAGLTRTLLLSYTPALYAAGAACIVAACAIFLIPPAVRVRQLSAATT
jgi:hypothetical protein